MRSGLLNERLTVYALATTVDAHGAKLTTLVAQGSYWCRVMHNRHDRENSDVERVVYNPEIRFQLRASIPIADSNIIEKDGMRYVIDIIEKDHNQDIQTLYCSRYESN